MRIVVTGASGFCGRATCRALEAAGHHVTAVVRTSDAAADVAADRVVALGELTPATDWAEALAGADGVAHLAARTAAARKPTASEERTLRQVNVDVTKALAEAALRAGARRFVFASSIKVNGEATVAGARFTAQSPVAPADLYARTKAEAEAVLLGLVPRGLEPVLLRPPVMYGPGMKGNLALLFRLAERGVPLPIAGVRNARDLLAVDAFADLVAHAAADPAAAGRILVARDGEAVSTPELYARIGRALGRPARMWPMPVAMLRLGGRMTGLAGEIERLVGDLEIDDSATRELLALEAGKGDGPGSGGDRGVVAGARRRAWRGSRAARVSLLLAALEQRIDERRDCRALGQHDQPAEQGHRDDDGQEPELLACPKEPPKLACERQHASPRLAPADRAGVCSRPRAPSCPVRPICAKPSDQRWATAGPCSAVLTQFAICSATRRLPARVM